MGPVNNRGRVSDRKTEEKTRIQEVMKSLCHHSNKALNEHQAHVLHVFTTFSRLWLHHGSPTTLLIPALPLILFSLTTPPFPSIIIHLSLPQVFLNPVMLPYHLLTTHTCARPPPSASDHQTISLSENVKETSG